MEKIRWSVSTIWEILFFKFYFWQLPSSKYFKCCSKTILYLAFWKIQYRNKKTRKKKYNNFRLPFTEEWMFAAKSDMIMQSILSMEIALKMLMVTISVITSMMLHPIHLTIPWWLGITNLMITAFTIWQATSQKCGYFRWREFRSVQNKKAVVLPMKKNILRSTALFAYEKIAYASPYIGFRPVITVTLENK